MYIVARSGGGAGMDEEFDGEEVDTCMQCQWYYCPIMHDKLCQNVIM